MDFASEELKYILEILHEHEWEYDGNRDYYECPSCGEGMNWRFNHSSGGYETFGGVHKEDCKLHSLIKKIGKMVHENEQRKYKHAWYTVMQGSMLECDKCGKTIYNGDMSEFNKDCPVPDDNN